jgi:hypothetical protein
MIRSILQNKLEEYIIKNNAEKSAERSNSHFHPSSIGYCARKIVYDRLNYPAAEMDATLLRIFQNGDHMHLRYQEYFEGMGIQIAEELELTEKSENQMTAERCKLYNIGGRTDSLIELEGESYLIELKSINGDSFKFQLSEPKSAHVDQLQLYMFLSGVHHGILLYENKNTQEIKMFTVDYNEENIEPILQKVLYVNKCVENKVLPPREGIRTDYKCKSCGHRGSCFGNIYLDGVTEQGEF